VPEFGASCRELVQVSGLSVGTKVEGGTSQHRVRRLVRSWPDRSDIGDPLVAELLALRDLGWFRRCARNRAQLDDTRTAMEGRTYRPETGLGRSWFLGLSGAASADLVGQRQDQLEQVDQLLAADRGDAVGWEHHGGSAGVLDACRELFEAERHHRR
jgi:hypothetical protein